MRHSPPKNDDLDLDLPALDGTAGEEEESTEEHASLEVADDGGDAFDDSTGEGRPMDELVIDGAEGGWLVDAEQAGTLDVGTFDLAVDAEGPAAEDDGRETHAGLEDLVSQDETPVVDTGEEGPLAKDEELREEDLPALDADDEGDVPDDDLYDDRSLLEGQEDLRWDDRAWERIAAVPLAADDGDDSGMICAPGDDPAQGARDAVWKRLDETGRVMAAAFVPVDGVVVALATTDRARAWLVRIPPSGDARIVAEIDPRLTQAEDDGESCSVTTLRWDLARGCIFAAGNFGVEAYRPV